MIIHKGQLTKFERKEYVWEGKPVVYYLNNLKYVRIGEVNQGIKNSKNLDNLLIRISDKAYNYLNLREGDIISCKGTIINDKYDGLILKKVYFNKN